MLRVLEPYTLVHEILCSSFHNEVVFAVSAQAPPGKGRDTVGGPPRLHPHLSSSLHFFDLKKVEIVL